MHNAEGAHSIISSARASTVAGLTSFPPSRRVRFAPIVLQNYFLLPGTRYALAALEALSPIALNSAPVQALAVVTSEIEPAAAAAIKAAIMFSASLASEMSRKSESPVVK